MTRCTPKPLRIHAYTQPSLILIFPWFDIVTLSLWQESRWTIQGPWLLLFDRGCSYSANNCLLLVDYSIGFRSLLTETVHRKHNDCLCYVTYIGGMTLYNNCLWYVDSKKGLKLSIWPWSQRSKSVIQLATWTPFYIYSQKYDQPQSRHEM